MAGKERVALPAPAPMTTSMKAAADVAAQLRARNPVIWIVSREEARVEEYVVEAALSAGYKPFFWDVAQGITTMSGALLDPQDPEGTLDSDAALKVIDAKVKQAMARARSNNSEPKDDRTVWIMRDLSVWLQPPIGSTPQRRLRNIAKALPGLPLADAQTIILLSTSANVPDELADNVTVVEWPLPDRDEVADLLDSSLEVQSDKVKSKATGAMRNAAIDAAVGLTSEEAQACFARSFAQLRTLDPGLIANEKKRVITKTGNMRLYDPIPGGLDAVGGLDVLKAWLTSRGDAYTDDARSYGLPAPRGALLVGVPGCLTGDTLVNIGRGDGSKYSRMRMDALFYKHNGQHKEGHKRGLFGSSKKWDLSVPTRAHCLLEDKGYIGFNEIDRVVYSGLKTVYELKTDHGYVIKATADHEFLTTRGYVRLDELAATDELYTQGDGVLINDNSTGRKANKSIRRVSNVGNHPYARRKVINGLDYTSHGLHRLVVEADMNGMRLEEFLWALEGDTTDLKFLAEGTEVHHKDRDRANNTLLNLEVLTTSDHARLHEQEDGNMNRWKCAPRLQKFASVERVGKMPTYDIQMRDPYRNFVANGLIVHNCGKTLTARAIGTAWNVPIIALDMGALKSKFVGESEGNLRRALQVIEAIDRCVVVIDEIEKAVAGATQGAADGGVSSDALGTMLSWMQDRKGRAFVLATANDVSALPPELMRPGRFDKVWFVDVPQHTERVEVLKASMATHGRADLDVNLAKVAMATEGFTGAELASLMPEALFMAFADGKREPTTRDLLAVAKDVNPMAKDNSNPKIAKLRDWVAAGNATRASSVENSYEEADEVRRPRGRRAIL